MLSDLLLDASLLPLQSADAAVDHAGQRISDLQVHACPSMCCPPVAQTLLW